MSRPQRSTPGLRGSMFNVLLCAFLLPASCLLLPAQPYVNGIGQQSEVLIVPTGEKFLRWFGVQGRTYFLFVSDPGEIAEPLRHWKWASVIESGNDVEISYEIGSSNSDKVFYRLHYTDLQPPPGVSLEEWDADEDGLSNIDELQLYQTNPLLADSDNDGLPDGWEVTNGLDPLDNGSINPANGAFGDPDGDGVGNIDEWEGGTNPMSETDFPVRAIVVQNRVNADSSQVPGSPPSGYLGKKPWNGPLLPYETIGEASPSLLHSAVSAMSFPATAEAAMAAPSEYVINSRLKDIIYAGASAAFHQVVPYNLKVGSTTSSRCWIRASAKTEEQRFHFLKVTTHRPAEDEDDFEDVVSVSHVILTIPPNASSSNHVDLIPSTQSEPDVVHSTNIRLIPVERAPDTLAVNSGFNEGRIDPITGYAIPDCDDQDIALEAQRNHLDGKYAANQRITTGLHPGFFGVDPSYFGKKFWDGATITIRKIGATDPDTGRPESGQIRLYGKWGEGPSQYRAIVPYDFQTLAATNLVTGGINGAPGESVYGENSPFPPETSWFIEGVHPGKITLEWRYQKGDVDITCEQSFEVLTRKNVNAWRLELDYKISLDTDNDPSGRIRTLGFPFLGDGYTENMERASEFYDFYRECYCEPLRSNPNGYPHALAWAGLARLAGNQVIGGLSDSQYGKLAAGSGLSMFILGIVGPVVDNWTVEEIEELQMALFLGGWDIFHSVGWQLHAYRSSGYRAIEYVANELDDDNAIALANAWKDLHQGVLDHDVELINRAALTITDREQNNIIIPSWAAISGMTTGPLLEFVFSFLGKNPCTPSGLDFTDLFPQLPVPTGSLANTADRWHWIDSATPSGILDTWNTESLPRKLVLTNDPIGLDAKRFSLFPAIPILCWDDEDEP